MLDCAQGRGLRPPQLISLARAPWCPKPALSGLILTFQFIRAFTVLCSEHSCIASRPGPRTLLPHTASGFRVGQTEARGVGWGQELGP